LQIVFFSQQDGSDGRLRVQKDIYRRSVLKSRLI
jgi:hypothetical protein